MKMDLPMSTSRRLDVSRGLLQSLLLPAIFFVSGFPALIYQLSWQRILFTVYGINVEAVTVIVSGFLLGLGLGSAVGGRISASRRVNLLVAFGMIELGIAVIGFFSLTVLRSFGVVSATWSAPVVTVTMLALIVVPTMLMGATLPILVAYLVDKVANVGRSVGLLYFVNTLGSAAACFMAGLFLMRILGMQGSVNAAAALNLLVSAGAFAGAFFEKRRQASNQKPTLPDTARAAALQATRSIRLAPSVTLAALCGYLALSYEILWFRAFSTATGTASAFALVLGAYLLGVAIGSLFGRRFCREHVEATRIVKVIILSLIASAALGFFLLPLSGLAASIGAFVPIMLALVAIHTMVTGMTFPLVAHLGIPPDHKAGQGVSTIYLANIIGSVAGTLITGFIIMDYWGLPEVTALLTAFGLILALALMPWGGAPRRARAIYSAALVAIIAVLPLALTPAFADLYERLVFKHLADTSPPFVATVENKSGVINVTDDNVVYGGGFYDGRIEIDFVRDRNLLARPAMLSYYHPAPKDVLMIGLSTGAWVQTLAANPSIERLTVIEINRGYQKIIAARDPVKSILHNPKVEIIIDDARRWLNRNRDRKFDAIVQNTTWHYRSNVTNLLSQEYLELVVQHLNPGGLSMYNTTASARAQRTACVRYPMSERYMTMMVVSRTALLADQDRLDQHLRAFQADGMPLLPDNDAANRRRAELVASAKMPDRADQGEQTIVESCASILARTQSLAVITDDNMGEEWRSALPDDRFLNYLVQVIKYKRGAP